jgi:hypothetical protein
MDYAPATFICWVASNEPLEELVNDAKALTWESGVEHAVIELQNGQKALVSGGRLGIEFLVMKDKVADPFGRRKQWPALKQSRRPKFQNREVNFSQSSPINRPLAFRPGNA